MRNYNCNIVLVGNYPLDRQESMERFAGMLMAGFQKAGYPTQIWRPVPLFGKCFKSSTHGWGKWMGYLDKWILFPLILMWRVRRLPRKGVYRFHVCDHSNAPYLPYLPNDLTAITCHDVLAIRGAFGDPSAYCPATRMGKLLQGWILAHLKRAPRLACVTANTLDELKRLAGPGYPGSRQDWRMIHNGFNDQYQPMDSAHAWVLLRNSGLSSDRPFILHVGSALPRKNRKMLLQMVSSLEQRWNGQICLAGQPMDEELRQLAAGLHLENRIVEVRQPDHATLTALYSTCAAFAFPSHTEGFGWPVIEAQACGAPVIASKLPPMPEVSGIGALLADPDDPRAFAEALVSLGNRTFRTNLVELGFENARRFDTARMLETYLDLHGLFVTIGGPEC